jgi:4-hydroxythreonine-4-phosphate dehydrogenase
MSIGTNKKRLPVVGITMGDAAGIGPEVIIKALSDSSLREKLRPVVIGDAKVLDGTLRSLGTEFEIVEYSASDSSLERALEVIDLRNVREGFEPGRFRSYWKSRW